MDKKITVEGCGNLDSKLWIVGESPGTEEVARRRPFVGSSGTFMREKFMISDFDIDNARLENLMNWQPPANKFEYFEEKCKEELDASVNNLCDRIRQAKPNLVFGVGAKPLHYFLNEKNISDWRGHIVFSEKLQCKTLFSYHPSACLRQYRVEKKQFPGQYAALFQVDTRRATEEMLTSDLPFPDIKLLIQPTFNEALSELERLLDEKRIISYDIETLGNCLMDCIGLCNNLSFSTCFPLYIPNSARQLIPYWKSTNEMVQILKRIKQLLESSIPKVAQNSAYDTIFLREFYKINVRNVCFDTMVMAHDLYSTLPKDLGCLITLFTKLPYHKYLIKTGKAVDRWNYNAMDSLANLHIMQGEEQDARELGVYNHYYTIPHQAIRPLNEMQIIGVNVDLDFRDQAIKREQILQESILNSIDKIFPNKINTDKKYPHKVNPRSGKDKITIFHKYFKCKVHTYKGSITLDSATMEIYEKDKRKYVSLLAKAFRLYLVSTSMQGRLEMELKGGRMHTAYGITGTDTGRTNSKESGIYGGGNLENLKKGQQRQMLIAG